MSVGQCVSVCLRLYRAVEGHGVKAGVDILVLAVNKGAVQGSGSLYMEQRFIQGCCWKRLREQADET